ncbi:MAG TPA: hypothetical protein VNB67_06420, partial [Nitrososphaeraceae archaeon]|nr:hypothetical protein [Nitrososphaeraceae archaeon]
FSTGSNNHWDSRGSNGDWFLRTKLSNYECHLKSADTLKTQELAGENRSPHQMQKRMTYYYMNNNQ